MRHEQSGRRERGLWLRTTSAVFMIIACLVAVALFAADYMVTRGYHEMEAASSNYISAKEAATDLEAASDYLTDRARCFVVTGEIGYLEDYFREAEVTKRRDKALEDLEVLVQGGENAAYRSLAKALDYSNELMELEYHAMRLTLEAEHYLPEALAKVPEVVQQFELSREEQAMSAGAKRTRAQALVFNAVYMDYKDKISSNVSTCTEQLIEKSREDLAEASGQMSLLLRVQAGFTVLLLAIVAVLVYFIGSQVRRPLLNMVELMRDQEIVPPTGAAELRFVTRTYNEILTENKAHQEKLAYEATHDPLTGLYNRGTYEMFMETMDTSHIALMLVDVDKFKTVNDTCGHDVGDQVLKRVSRVLKSSFRSVDFVCRIGGDEFAVILTRVNSSMSRTIREKILQANEILQQKEGDLPATTLSVGIAFADRKNPGGDIFKDADTALYAVKKAGRCGCAVYGEQQESSTGA